MHSLASFLDYIENQEKTMAKEGGEGRGPKLSNCLEFTYSKDASRKMRGGIPFYSVGANLGCPKDQGTK